MDFKLEQFNRNIDKSSLLKDLQRVNKILLQSDEKISTSLYNKLGKYSIATINTRFGAWNRALVEAKLNITQEKNVNEEKLFNNLKEVWIYKGSQPVFRDMCKKPSKYSAQTYSRKYGGWRNALEAFIKYIDSNNEHINDPEKSEFKNTDSVIKKVKKRRRTNRNISERLRFSILLRDGFRCQSCGKSPIKSPGTDLHVDHITPWSKGGETIPENLQIKCKQCNLGKGNVFNK